MPCGSVWVCVCVCGEGSYLTLAGLLLQLRGLLFNSHCSPSRRTDLNRREGRGWIICLWMVDPCSNSYLTCAHTQVLKIDLWRYKTDAIEELDEGTKSAVSWALKLSSERNSKGKTVEPKYGKHALLLSAGMSSCTDVIFTVTQCHSNTISHIRSTTALPPYIHRVTTPNPFHIESLYPSPHVDSLHSVIYSQCSLLPYRVTVPFSSCRLPSLSHIQSVLSPSI